MISVRASGSVVVLALDGEAFLRVGSIGELIAAAKELEGNDPLGLASGVTVEIELREPDRAALLEAFRPAEDADALDVLRSRWDDASEDSGLTEELEPLDDRILVNGQPWGWYWVSRGDQALERFYLFPLGPRDEVLRMEAWQSGSMTGAVITAKLVRCDDLAALAWYDDDYDLQWMTVLYDIKDAGLEAACQKLLEAFSDYWSPICPVEECDNENDWGMTAGGWVITVNASKDLDERTLACAVAALYKPCEEHMPQCGADGDEVLSVAGQDWKWEHERWVNVK
jgi:hypothetical protein